MVGLRASNELSILEVASGGAGCCDVVCPVATMPPICDGGSKDVAVEWLLLLIVDCNGGGGTVGGY